MEQIRKIVPEPVRDLTPVVLAAAGGLYLISKAGSCIIANIQKKRMLNKWKDSPKDVVVIHTIARGKTAPNLSPFVLKLETYLRMANIPYQLDNQYPWHPETGKTPWITLNGQHYTDSQLIVEMLAKKFDKKFGMYTDAERALGTVVRVVADEHLYWALCTWRYVIDGGRNLDKIFDLPPAALRVFRRMAGKRIAHNAWCQGTYRLKTEDIFHIMSDELKAVSLLLGNKKFILGDEASEDDCALFGMLAQFLWCAPGSPYERLINEELLNLRDYCVRMKETFWPDWEKCLALKHA